MFDKQEYLTIASILNRAAELHLYCPNSNRNQGSKYSCNAYLVACIDSGDKQSDHFSMVEKFLYDELGFNNTAPFPLNVFDEEMQQCFRYDWLKFAAMYAEEKAAEIIMLSDVFHLAADKYLSADQNVRESGKSYYSCDSVGYAIGKLADKPSWSCKFTPKIRKFLIDAGLPASDFGIFEDIAITKRQECRYMWLKMLAEYAESEQIEAKEFIG